MLKSGRRVWSAVMVAVALGILALASWMYIRSGFGALAGIASDSVVVHMDFDVFWRSARALLEGGDVYSENGGPSISTNPPFWTVLLMALAFLLLALQSIPPQWSEPWRGESTVLAAVALTLYFFILVAHWLAFLTDGEEATKDQAKIGNDQSASVE